MVGLLHLRHDDLLHQELTYLDPVAHWLRDALFYAPAGTVLLLLATLAARQVAMGWGRPDDGVAAALLWAALGALAYALASVPATAVHALLFAHGHAVSQSLVATLEEAIVTLRYSLAVLLATAMVVGVPWGPPARLRVRSPRTAPARTSSVPRRRNAC